MAITAPKRLFSTQEYQRLGELGFFSPNDRVELIRGELVTMSPKGTKHAVCCTRLIAVLLPLLKNQYSLRCQDPITLPKGSAPEPDLTIVTAQDYIAGHPTPKDILLVIEIADTSLDYDRGVKAILYAEADIAHYWLIDVINARLEAYSQPRQGIYTRLEVYLPEDQVCLPLPQVQQFRLDQVLPPTLTNPP
jgi:Uma2 family endonuclease